MTFDWNRSETIAIAKESCAHCQGFGLRARHTDRKLDDTPCNCVLREIFRSCFSRFRSCVRKEKHMSQARIELIGGRERRPVWGRKNEEYVADFCLVSKRNLDEFEYQIFRFHFLLGADWRLCCRRLNMDKGLFFHSVYGIQQKLGRAFRELKPYPLFPLDEYFGSFVGRSVRAESAADPAEESRKVIEMPLPQLKHRPLRPPVRKVA